MLGLFIDHNPGRVNQAFAASSTSRIHVFMFCDRVCVSIGGAPSSLRPAHPYIPYSPLATQLLTHIQHNAYQSSDSSPVARGNAWSGRHRSAARIEGITGHNRWSSETSMRNRSLCRSRLRMHHTYCMRHHCRRFEVCIPFRPLFSRQWSCGWQGPSGNRFTGCLYRSERVRENSLQGFPQRSSLFACRFSWIFVDGGLGGLYKWPSRRRRMRLAGRLIGRGIVGSRLGTCVQSSSRSSPTVVVVCVIKAALSFGG